MESSKTIGKTARLFFFKVGFFETNH